MTQVSIVIPEKRAGLFKEQAAFTFECAADVVADSLKMDRRRGEAPKALTDEWLELEQAETLWAETDAQDGEIHVGVETARARALRSTLQGCVLHASSTVGDEGETINPALIRDAMADLDWWLEALEGVDSSQAEDS